MHYLSDQTGSILIEFFNFSAKASTLCEGYKKEVEQNEIILVMLRPSYLTEQTKD